MRAQLVVSYGRNNDVLRVTAQRIGKGDERVYYFDSDSLPDMLAQAFLLGLSHGVTNEQQREAEGPSAEKEVGK